MDLNTLNNQASIANAVNKSPTSPTSPTYQTPSQNQQIQQGGLFKQDPNATTAQTNQEIAKEALDNIDRLVSKVMSELNKGEAAKTAIIQQANDTKIAPNMTKDLQNLTKSLESNQALQNDPILNELTVKLKQFLKPIADLKTANLGEQIKNSGIMLEANIKEALNPQKLPAPVQKLLVEIKNLSNQDLLNQILQLASDDSLETSEAFTKLNDILNTAKTKATQTLEHSPIKNLLSGANKLDDMAKFLDKINFNLEQKELKLNAETIKNQLTRILDTSTNLKNTLELINNNNERLKQNVGFISNSREFTKIVASLQESINTINLAPNESELIRNFTTTITHDGDSLQDKLKTAAARLAQSLNFMDKNASEAKANLNEIKVLNKQLEIVKKEPVNVEAKTAPEIAKTLTSDVKTTLLSLHDKLSNFENSQQFTNQTSKMISQIELHQIVSSLSGGLQTYLPYVWDGVDRAKVAFKRGKKDKFYAQIDLNFKEFGAINILASLSEQRYIDISIATQKAEFKELITNNQSELKRSIGELGLMVSGFSIKVLPKNEIKERFKSFEGLEMGYDVRA
ncbi:MAG: flagellar hook-length control protein FliK [Campylobacter sp.]|nr:flagellar hook-length control protein FliK [Campylobacter sp.]